MGCQAVYDGQAKPASALAKSRRKKRVENAGQVFGRNSLAVVTEINLYFSGAGFDCSNPDFTIFTASESMRVRVSEQVQEYLSKGAWIALQGKNLRYVDNDLRAVSAVAQFKGLNDFFDHFTEIEFSSTIAGLVDCHFLEICNQRCCSREIAYQHFCRGFPFGQKIAQARTADSALIDLLRQLLHCVLQGRCNGQAVAYRGIQFVGNAGNHRAERCEPFGSRQFVLGQGERVDCFLQLAVRACEFSCPFADAHFQLQVEFPQIVFDPAKVSDIEHGSDDAFPAAIGKANDSLVKDHVVQAAISGGNLRLVDLQTTIGEKFLVLVTEDQRLSIRVGCFDGLADQFILRLAEVFEKCIVHAPIAHLAILEIHRKRCSIHQRLEQRQLALKCLRQYAVAPSVYGLQDE